MSRPPYVSVSLPEAQRGVRISAALIVERVLAEIRSGCLPEGSRLPPVRVLERRFGMSKNTAQAAYEELCARGAVESREREGYFVCAPAPRAESAAGEPAPSLAFNAPTLAVATRVPAGSIALSTVFVDPE